jgi:hypothetical protein
MTHPERLEPYGYRPDANSGHYQRHLNGILGSYESEGKLYTIKDVPGYLPNCLGRSNYDLKVLPPQEYFSEKLNKPEHRIKLRETIDERNLPPAYFEHPVVVEHSTADDQVRPLSIFVDGLPYSINDSVIGFWVKDDISGDRCLSVILRKRRLCRCVCHGWCTLWPVLHYLSWVFACFADGSLGVARHDLLDWLESDSVRRGRENLLIGFRAALIWLKGDWMERVTTFGFPNFNDGLRPCAICNGCGEVLQSVVGLGFDHQPWRPNGIRDYYDACCECEHNKMITQEHHAALVPLLAFDKRQHGNHGLCLIADYLPLELVKGDRLEPSSTLFDVGVFLRGFAVFPVFVTFWRCSSETLTRHRNPFFNRDVGMEPQRIITQDSLHALYIGVMLSFCRFGVWVLISSGIWGATGTGEENLQVSCLVFKSQLRRWYVARHGQCPLEHLTRVADITPKDDWGEVRPKTQNERS